MSPTESPDGAYLTLPKSLPSPIGNSKPRLREDRAEPEPILISLSFEVSTAAR